MAGAAQRKGVSLATARTFVCAVVRRFLDDDCLLRASALTYTSLLSLVPLLAVMFAALKGLGVQRRLEPLLLARLSLDHETTQQILAYIDRTNVGTLGALGAAALITTVLSVLGSIEGSFNHIWRVGRGRTWWRKATDYVSTVLLTPFLLLAAVAITSSVREQAVLRWVFQTEYIGPAALRLISSAPLVINTVALGLLYAVMPNRRPYLPGLVLGACAAGCAWQLVQSAYVSLQIGVARYSAIYGALAQLPVTLVWIYVSWTVVLAGAELAAVCEWGPEARGGTAASGMAIALHLLLHAAERFRHGGAIELQPLARGLAVDTGVAAEIAEQLCTGGLLATVDGGRLAYVLARDPTTIDLAALARLVDRRTLPLGCDPRVSAFLERLDVAGEEALQGRTLADLVAAPDA